MALTIAKVTSADGTTPANGGALNFVLTRVTFDASYPTGGETLNPSDVGLSMILYVIPNVNTAGNRLALWDDTTNKLKLYTALGTEAANTSDQSAIVVQFLVIGY